MNQALLITLMTFFLTGCNSSLLNKFKITNEIRSEYGIDYVEMTWNESAVTFTLQDIDHRDLSIETMQGQSTRIDEYLTTKYPQLKHFESRKYLYTTGIFEIFEFTLDINGQLVNKKLY